MEITTKPLLEAINDAYLMLRFASSNGLEIKREIVNNIVDTKTNINNMSTDQETVFWLAYAEISKIILPVTLDGILAKSETYLQFSILGKTIKIPFLSAAKRSVFWYTVLTFVFLCLFLVIEMYSFFGASALNDINSIHEKQNNTAESVSRQVNSNKLDNNKSISIENDNRKTSDEPDDAEIKNMINKENALYEFLSTWNDKSDFFMGLFYKTNSQDNHNNQDSEGKPAVKSCFVEIQQNILQQVVAEYMVKSLNLYIVPMICGILGVCSYILRKMSVEMENNTYTKESRIRFRLRIPLGCLAGVVAGFIFNTTSNSGITAVLPPIGVAFAFGYSVEVFFSVLDNILSTLTKK